MLIRAGFGERLKQERERLDFSQQEFSELIGLSPNTQRAYEKGKVTLNLGYLQTVERLGVNTMYVLAGRLEQENCLTPEEFQLVTTYRALATRQRHSLVRIAVELKQKTEVQGR